MKLSHRAGLWPGVLPSELTSASTLTLTLTLAFALPGSAPAAVVIVESGIVTGIDGLPISGGGMDGVFDIRFHRGPFATAMQEYPDRFPIYDSPLYGAEAAVAVVTSINNALNAGDYMSVGEIGEGGMTYMVPYASILGPDPSLSYFAMGYNNYGTTPITWQHLGNADLSNYYIAPVVLMTSVPEPTAVTAVGGGCLAGLAAARWARSGARAGTR